MYLLTWYESSKLNNYILKLFENIYLLCQLIFVIPSIYLSASDALVSRGYSNKDFVYAVFDDFFGSDTPPYGCKPILYDTETLENLTMGTAKIYTALIMLIPAAAALVGAVILIRRKNR